MILPHSHSPSVRSVAGHGWGSGRPSEGWKSRGAMPKAVRLLFNKNETGDSLNKIYVFAEEHCVICGATIPEGRQVCPSCETAAAPNKRIDLRLGIPAPKRMDQLRSWLHSLLKHR